MLRVFASVLLAGALLVATASTALMATPAVGATSSFDNGLGLVSFIYDASLNPPLITTVQVDNNDTHNVTVQASFLTTDAAHTVVWSGAQSFPPGTTLLDVSPLGQHMVQINTKFGPRWAFPFIVSTT